MFWGVFPDLFAFTIPFAWVIWHVLVGDPVSFPSPDAIEPAPRDTTWTFELASRLYNVSHSFVVFVVVVVIVILIRYFWRQRRPKFGGPPHGENRLIPWELGGWLLHILIDIPTHTYRFFPTPVLWPISEWKFNGISWATPTFLIINYSLLAIFYGLLWFFRKKPKIRNINDIASR